MDYTIKKIGSMDELIPLKEKWNSLLMSNETNTIFLTFEWISSWWNSFRDGRELFILTVEKNNEIIGIAPLMITHHKKFRVRIRKLGFIGTPLSNSCDFIISKEKEQVLQAIYDYILEGRDCWDIIDLKDIPETSSTLSISQRVLDKHNVFFNFFVSDLSHYLVLEGSNRKTIEKKIKQRTLRRRINYFNRTGKLSFVGYNDLKNFDEANELLEKFFEQHMLRWKSTSTPSMFHDPRYRNFYHDILRYMLPKKWVNLSVLKFNDDPIAFLLGFIYNNKHSEYSVSFDPEYVRRSPGMIAFKYAIEDAINEGLVEYDLGRGNSPYKSRFTDKVRKNFKISIHQNYLIFLLDMFWEKTKEEIMKHDKLSLILSEFKNRMIRFYAGLSHHN